jgi:hypothetical protein
VTDHIEPALTPDEWRMIRGRLTVHEMMLDESVKRGLYAMAIALLNDFIPDADPRKITREKVVRLRVGSDPEMVGPIMEHRDALIEIADALESYLPRES